MMMMMMMVVVVNIDYIYSMAACRASLKQI